MATIEYDVMIVGSGPAGLTAAMYAQRFGLSSVVLGDTPGGNLYMIEKIRNWPGSPAGVPGAQLGAMMFSQAQQEGAFIPMARLISLTICDGGFQGETTMGQTLTAHAVILCTGVVPRSLGVKGEDKLGIHYCAMCDGPLYKETKCSELVVVGGGNMAAHEALILSQFVDRVKMIHRRGELRADKALQKEIEEKPNIKLVLDVQVKEVIGEERASGVLIHTPDGKELKIDAGGVFVCVGWKPDLSVVHVPVETTDEGFVKTGQDLRSSHPGLFAAGDIRDTPLRQVVSACADGALAAKSVRDYIRELDL